MDYNYTTGKNRLFWRFLIIIFFSIIIWKSNAVKDIYCNTYYENQEWDSIAGRHANAWFTSIELVEDGPADMCRYGIGTLSNGKRIIICYRYAYTEPPRTDILTQGYFYFPKDTVVAYMTQKYDTEYMVFRYLGENYFETDVADYIILGFGFAGLALCMFLYVARKLNYKLNDFKQYFIPEKYRQGAGEPDRQKKQRDSNFEILRILCILMVIMQHFGYWGEFDISGNITANTVILQTIVNFGKIGVNCFMLITGYYMVNSGFRFSKVLRLAGTVWFYSWISGIIFTIWNRHTIDMDTFLKTVFPVMTGQYWFITIYLIIYILSPLLNGAVKAISREYLRNILVMLYIMWSVLTMLPLETGWGFTNTGWMVLMYFTGAYVKLYGAGEKNAGYYLYRAVMFYVLLMILTVLWDHQIVKIVYQSSIAQKHSIFIVLTSLYLFAFFSKLRPWHSRFINKIASCSFAVYLIHENFIVKKYLWTEWLVNNRYFDSNAFLLYAAGTILLVYIVCVVIELVRQLVTEAVLKIIFSRKKQQPLSAEVRQSENVSAGGK